MYEICWLWEDLGPDPETSVVTCPQSFNLEFLGSPAPRSVGDSNNGDLKQALPALSLWLCEWAIVAGGGSGKPFGAAACQSLPAGVCCEIFYFIVKESDTRIKGNIETLKCIFQYSECKHKY